MKINSILCVDLGKNRACSHCGSRKRVRSLSLYHSKKMLPIQKISHELRAVFDDIVKLINLIKAYPFIIGCLSIYVWAGMQARLPFLARRSKKLLPRKLIEINTFISRYEFLQSFLLEKNLFIFSNFSDEKCILKPAYLCDIFNLLEELIWSFTTRQNDNCIEVGRWRACLWLLKLLRPCQKIIENFLVISDLMFAPVWSFCDGKNKTISQNRLDLGDTHWVSLSSIISQWERLVAAK